MSEETAQRTRYLLIYLDNGSPIDNQPVLRIRRMIEDTVKEPREQVEVDVWLESPGGDAHSAFKLALMLRHVACHIRVVVPDYAKSAATLLALVGHEIYIAPGAELGPLDAQIEDEDSIVKYISALSIAKAVDEIAGDAVALVGTGGAQLIRRTGLGRTATLDSMLQFSARFYEPLVRQLDPRLVHHAKELLKATTKYAEYLLKDTVADVAARRIAKDLVEDFPTHGFVIGYEQAKELGLPAKPLDDYEMLEQCRSLHRICETGDGLVHFTSVEQFISELEGSDDDGIDETSTEGTSGGDQQDDLGTDG